MRVEDDRAVTTLKGEIQEAVAQIQRERAKFSEATKRADEERQAREAAVARADELFDLLSEARERCTRLMGQVEEEKTSHAADKEASHAAQRLLEIDLENALGWRIEAVRLQAEVRLCEDSLSKALGLQARATGEDCEANSRGRDGHGRDGHGRDGTSERAPGAPGVRKAHTLMLRKPGASPVNGSPRPGSPRRNADTQVNDRRRDNDDEEEVQVGVALAPRTHALIARFERAEQAVRTLTQNLSVSMEQCEVAVREIGRLQQVSKVERQLLVQTSLAALAQLRNHLTFALSGVRVSAQGMNEEAKQQWLQYSGLLSPGGDTMVVRFLPSKAYVVHDGVRGGSAARSARQMAAPPSPPPSKNVPRRIDPMDQDSSSGGGFQPPGGRGEPPRGVDVPAESLLSAGDVAGRVPGAKVVIPAAPLPAREGLANGSHPIQRAPAQPPRTTAAPAHGAAHSHAVVQVAPSVPPAQPFHSDSRSDAFRVPAGIVPELHRWGAAVRPTTRPSSSVTLRLARGAHGGNDRAQKADPGAGRTTSGGGGGGAGGGGAGGGGAGGGARRVNGEITSLAADSMLMPMPLPGTDKAGPAPGTLIGMSSQPWSAQHEARPRPHSARPSADLQLTPRLTSRPSSSRGPRTLAEAAVGKGGGSVEGYSSRPRSAAVSEHGGGGAGLGSSLGMVRSGTPPPAPTPLPLGSTRSQSPTAAGMLTAPTRTPTRPQSGHSSIGMPATELVEATF